MSYLFFLSLVLYLSVVLTWLFYQPLTGFCISEVLFQCILFKKKKCCKWPYKYAFLHNREIYQNLYFAPIRKFQNSLTFLSYKNFFLRRNEMWDLNLTNALLSAVDPWHKCSAKLPVHLSSFPSFVLWLYLYRKCSIYFKKSLGCMILSWPQKNTVALQRHLCLWNFVWVFILNDDYHETVFLLLVII